jgi:hypothetical protein
MKLTKIKSGDRQDRQAGRLYLFSFSFTVLIDITPNHMTYKKFSGATLHDITRKIHNKFVYPPLEECRK